jgi:hypothetical protein
MPPPIYPTQPAAASKMPPKNPNIVAKIAADKTATMQPGKAATKSAVKVPFSKARKAPLVKKKLKTWTQEEWEEADYVHRKYETSVRRDRRLAQGEKKATIADAMHVAALTAGSSTARPYIPSSASLSTPGFFSDHRSAMSRFSPHYGNNTHRDGFNPNAMFSPTYDEMSARAWR